MSKWLVNQIGAREEYAIAYALSNQDALAYLQTDIWFDKGNPMHRALKPFAKSLVNRNNVNIPNVKVVHESLKHILLKKCVVNNEYERMVLKHFLNVQKNLESDFETLFCYNYAAFDSFSLAHKMKKKCVLGQVDAGPIAGEIISQLFVDEGVSLKLRKDYYRTYLPKWQEECDMAENIVVNSNWSKKCLVEAGISESKIRIFPVLQQSKGNVMESKFYPEKFTMNRPMKVLFVGRISLQKGCLEIIRAAREFLKTPVQFTLVGEWAFPENFSVDIPENVSLTGRKTKTELDELYQSHDVFLFPTYTDGFGKVLLEAQQFRMPIICSPYCGDVVENNETGILLEGNTKKYIINALMECLESPEKLLSFSAKIGSRHCFSVANLGKALTSL